MQLPPCPVCGQPVHPHTLSCPCGTELVFLPDEGRFSSDAPQCANRAQIGCNWQAETEAGLCRSCAMTQTVPDLAIEESTALWSETERAKRLAIQGFVRLGWFTPEDTGPRPVFHLLAERTVAEGRVKVLMAHADGEVTLNVAEADPAIRAIRQKDMDEDFRSMVGHVRHEMGHFVFWRLSQGRMGDTQAVGQAAAKSQAVFADGLRQSLSAWQASVSGAFGASGDTASFAQLCQQWAQPWTAPSTAPQGKAKK